MSFGWEISLERRGWCIRNSPPIFHLRPSVKCSVHACFCLSYYRISLTCEMQRVQKGKIKIKKILCIKWMTSKVSKDFPRAALISQESLSFFQHSILFESPFFIPKTTIFMRLPFSFDGRLLYHWCFIYIYILKLVKRIFFDLWKSKALIFFTDYSF